MSQPDETPHLLAAATELIDSLGVKIVLLHGIRPDGTCTCDDRRCPSRGKHPRFKDWKSAATQNLDTISQWLQALPDANLGWVPGPRLLVIDIDPRNGGVMSAKRMGALLPRTRYHFTGGNPVDGERGRHAIYTIDPDTPLRQTGKLAPGVDFKTGDGSLLVAPGSITDLPYTIGRGPLDPADAPPELLDALIRRRLTAVPDTPQDDKYDYGQPIQAGSRDNTLAQYAGDVAGRVGRGILTEAEGIDLVRGAWAKVEQLPDDQITEERAIDMFHRFLERDHQRDEDPDEPDEEPVLADGRLANDIANSERLLDIARGRAHWVDTWGTWIVYQDGRWILDSNRVRILEIAKQAVEQMRDLAARLPRKQRESLRKWANRTAQATNLEAMVKLARGRLHIDHDQLNQHPHLLNVLNGTIDLHTNDLLPASPAHLLTVQAQVEYDPQAACPNWLEWLQLVQPDEQIRWFLQKAAGSGLIGYAVQHFFVNWGEGGNGKGTFFSTIHRVLGNDYYTVPHESLIVSNRYGANQQHATVKASLFGARTAVAAETEEGARLNVASIKELTGGDVLRARRMREDEWSFLPGHTLFLHTNHRPRLGAVDEGLRRRMFLIPWGHRVAAKDKDDNYARDRLWPEAAGILNWLLEGCAGFLDEGFNHPPEGVRAATDHYLIEGDVLARFFADCRIERKPGDFTPVADLQRAYQGWCSEQGLKLPPPWPQVSDKLAALGGEEMRRRYNGKPTRGWRDIVIGHG